MKEPRRIPAVLTGLLLILATAAPVSLAQDEGTGLSALMQRNRDHFSNLVRIAFFESTTKPLSPPDFQRIRQEAEAITEIARQVRQNHSRGEKFDELSKELEKHAEKAAQAAAKENLPEVNLQVGEMAEYCAECHNAFRW